MWISMRSNSGSEMRETYKFFVMLSITWREYTRGASTRIISSVYLMRYKTAKTQENVRGDALIRIDLCYLQEAISLYISCFITLTT